MKEYVIGLLSTVGFAAGLGGASVLEQSGADTVEAHVAAARAAAGREYTAMLSLCAAPAAAQPLGTRVIMSAADWDLLDRSTQTKPKRDLVATDGQKLTLGDTTLTLYLTPGHTLGTISTLIPVKDGGKPHLVAEWGGTQLNWIRKQR